eukprot:3451091-Pyramimonas_sp.AAC.1
MPNSKRGTTPPAAAVWQAAVCLKLDNLRGDIDSDDACLFKMGRNFWRSSSQFCTYRFQGKREDTDTATCLTSPKVRSDQNLEANQAVATTASQEAPKGEHRASVA